MLWLFGSSNSSFFCTKFCMHAGRVLKILNSFKEMYFYAIPIFYNVKCTIRLQPKHVEFCTQLFCYTLNLSSSVIANFESINC